MILSERVRVGERRGGEREILCVSIFLLADTYLFDDAAVPQHDDVVGVPYGPQPVSDDEASPFGSQPVQGLLDAVLGQGIEGRSRLMPCGRGKGGEGGGVRRCFHSFRCDQFGPICIVLDCLWDQKV